MPQGSCFIRWPLLALFYAERMNSHQKWDKLMLTSIQQPEMKKMLIAHCT